MSFLKSSCACTRCFISVAPRVCPAKVPFLSIFGPNMKTEIGVVIYIYLKRSPDYTDSKYIWIHGSNSLGSRVLAEIQFLTFLDLHRERRGVALCDQAHVTLIIKSYMHTKF